MKEAVTDPLEYYATPGPMTNPQAQASLFDDLPRDVPALCRIVQGILIHIFWAEQQGVNLSDERKQEVQIRSVPRKLARIRELDNRSLTVARPPENRLVGNCRDFSVMLCSILRYQGIQLAPDVGSAHTLCRITLKITGCASIGNPTDNAGRW